MVRLFMYYVQDIINIINNNNWYNIEGKNQTKIKVIVLYRHYHLRYNLRFYKKYAFVYHKNILHIFPKCKWNDMIHISVTSSLTWMSKHPKIEYHHKRTV